MKSAAKPRQMKAVLTKSVSGWYFLNFPAATAKHFETDGRTRRVVCTLNDTHSFQCALLPNKGEFGVGVNTEIRKKLGLDEGDMVSVRLEPDTSKYGAPMSEEFEEVLNQDQEGSRLFHALTPGKQRSLIFLVGSVKNIDKRIHLGLIVMEHLKKNDGKIIGAKLHEDMKRPAF